MCATGLDVASVVGARILVIAGQGRARTAFGVLASLASGATVAIVAGCGVAGDLDATGLAVTTIGGANVFVVAVDRRTSDALAVFASILVGAGVIVGANRSIIGVYAAGRGLAFVVCTGILVVAARLGAGRLGIDLGRRVHRHNCIGISVSSRRNVYFPCNFSSLQVAVRRHICLRSSARLERCVIATVRQNPQ